MSMRTQQLFEIPLTSRGQPLGYYAQPESEYEWEIPSVRRHNRHPSRPTPSVRRRPPFFKDSPTLKNTPLVPTKPIVVNPRWPERMRRIADTYNRLGGLMQTLAGMESIDVRAVLAVWFVESNGRTHVPGRAIIRFENHLFFMHWGRHNEALYNRHFQHAGGVHLFRENPDEPFRKFHNRQQSAEYQVFNFAVRLAGADSALRSISIGGPQILVSNHRIIGYATPRAMFDAFQADERTHVLGFFDFCKQNNLVRFLQARDWTRFARRYNGPGQVARYGSDIKNAYNDALRLPLP
jgi:N-acetylmuramidase